jgi:hypothetical protein
MIRSFAAFACALAGVWLLAGPGWALITAAFLVFALWPRGADAPVVAWARRAGDLARAGAGRVKTAPRRMAATGSMVGAVALIPAGFGIAVGIGVGVAAAGFTLAGVSLLAGWNA